MDSGGVGRRTDGGHLDGGVVELDFQISSLRLSYCVSEFRKIELNDIAVVTAVWSDALPKVRVT